MTKQSTKKAKDIPVTQEMLYEVRGELKSDISCLRHEMKSEFKQVNSRFEQIDSRFEQIDSRFEQNESKLEKILSVVHDIQSKVHRTQALVEEQNSRNKYVLDGYAALHERLNRQEKRHQTDLQEIKDLLRNH